MLKPLDTDHFYFNDVLIDLNQIRHQFSSIHRPWGHGHMMAQLVGNLIRAAEYLNKHQMAYEGLEGFVEKTVNKMKGYGFKI
jgi:hypothetical protein